MKTVLIISYSPLHKDPRILRQISALKDGYRIITIGYTPVADNKIVHYPVNMPEKNSLTKKIQLLFLLLKKDYQWYYKRALDLENILSKNIESPDVIIANDWNGLYLASELKSHGEWQAKIYFDAHEYAPKEFDASIKWRLLIQPIIINALKQCKKHIAVMSTVCEGLAREYEQFFDFPAGFVKVVTNAAEYEETLKPRELHNNKIRLIHHGGAMKQRKLELMIKMMHYLDPEKYDLTFMLVSSAQRYYDYLVKISRKFKNIHFINPVAFSEISQKLNEYDIGVFILEPHNFNYKYALPNKLFEFIQARLAIAIGPSIEMAKIINQYDLGVVSETFAPKLLAKKIAALTPEKLMEHKKNSDKYAKLLSAESNILKISDFVAKLTGELKCVE